MAMTSPWDLSTTANSNTLINGVNVAENCPMNTLNNGIREVAAELATYINYVSTSGTDTYTATLAETPAAYNTGNTYWIKFVNANTSTTPTINLNSLGAKTIVRIDGTALVAGDLNGVHALAYDGTNMRVLNPIKTPIANLSGTLGALINVQYFTSTATYTPTAGTTACLIEALGGGGAGGGMPTTNGSQAAAGGGGGAGGYSRKKVAVATISGATVTIGAAGAGSAGANGGNGGATSIISVIVANGGNGGLVGSASTTTGINASGNTGGTATTGDLNIQGASGESGLIIAIANNGVISGAGANSMYGAGGAGTQGSSVGTAGTGFGSGGSGAATGPNLGASAAGGNGTPGLMIIWEYK